MHETGDFAHDAPRRVALFGGSFDPPHLGHVAVARAAQSALRLDSILFAPVGAQPLKPHGSTAGFEQRVAMTRLAIASDSTFSVSLADQPNADGAPNYTWQTLQQVRRQLPSDTQVFFLMGADSLASFRRWFRAAEIPFVAALVVASRPGEDMDDLKALFPSSLIVEPDPDGRSGTDPSHTTGRLRSYSLRSPAGDRAAFYLLPDVEVEISASQIREQIREQVRDPKRFSAEVAAHLSFPVLEYIRAHKLYL
jgi:nicotinate-nucleotide adenylyltransferase